MAPRFSLCALLAALEHRRRTGEGQWIDVSQVESALQFIAPVDDRYIPLAPANRACWTSGRICEQIPDLIAWRDELYRTHRRVEHGRAFPA